VREYRDNKMTLAARLAIAMILLVAIAVSAVGWLSYRSLEQALLPRVLDRIETHSRFTAADLESYVAGARGDISGFRSAAALDGLIRAHLMGGIDPVDGVSERTWSERIAARLLAEVEAKPAYAVLRIIGLDDGGREIVRVDHFGSNGAIRSVAEPELQRRGDRAYFRDTIKLPPGEIYVSPLDLGRVYGDIETPHRPTLRVATPVFAPDGKPFGIVIVNVDMGPAFDHVPVIGTAGRKGIRCKRTRRLSGSPPTGLANSARIWARRLTGGATSRHWHRRLARRGPSRKSYRIKHESKAE